MRRFVIPVAAFGLLAAAVATSTGTVVVAEDEVTDQKVLGYGIGFMLGKEVRDGLEADGVVVNSEDIVSGFLAGLHGEEPAIDEDDLDRVMFAVHKEMSKRTTEHRLKNSEEFRDTSEANLAESLEFLQKQSKMPGTQTLPNGAMYRIMEAGDGTTPTPDDVVIVSYKVTLPNGIVAHADINAEIQVEDALAGVRPLLLMMRPGDHWEIILPPELGYGRAGKPPAIGPNQALLLDVTLQGIK